MYSINSSETLGPSIFCLTSSFRGKCRYVDLNLLKLSESPDISMSWQYNCYIKLISSHTERARVFQIVERHDEFFFFNQDSMVKRVWLWCLKWLQLIHYRHKQVPWHSKTFLPSVNRRFTIYHFQPPLFSIAWDVSTTLFPKKSRHCLIPLSFRK